MEKNPGMFSSKTKQINLLNLSKLSPKGFFVVLFSCYHCEAALIHLYCKKCYINNGVLTTDQRTQINLCLVFETWIHCPEECSCSLFTQTAC